MEFRDIPIKLLLKENFTHFKGIESAYSKCRWIVTALTEENFVFYLVRIELSTLFNHHYTTKMYFSPNCESMNSFALRNIQREAGLVEETNPEALIRIQAPEKPRLYTNRQWQKSDSMG